MLRSPFVCKSRPERATVILLGENPATTMSTDGWSYWSDERGFDLARFEADYQALRRSVGKRPKSNTRLRLDRIRQAGCECLETNVLSNEHLAGHGALNEPAAHPVNPRNPPQTP